MCAGMALADSALIYHRTNVFCAFPSHSLYKITDLKAGLVRAKWQIGFSIRRESLAAVYHGDLTSYWYTSESQTDTEKSGTFTFKHLKKNSITLKQNKCNGHAFFNQFVKSRTW